MSAERQPFSMAAAVPWSSGGDTSTLRVIFPRWRLFVLAIVATFTHSNTHFVQEHSPDQQLSPTPVEFRAQQLAQNFSGRAAGASNTSSKEVGLQIMFDLTGIPSKPKKEEPRESFPETSTFSAGTNKVYTLRRPSPGAFRRNKMGSCQVDCRLSEEQVEGLKCCKTWSAFQQLVRTARTHGMIRGEGGTNAPY